MRNILMFVNPHARQGAQFGTEIKSWLEGRGFNVLNASFDATKDKISDVIYRHQKEASAVLIGGGDGSVNAALPALLETGLPLLIVPLGTANNLARTLKIPSDLSAALDLLNTGTIHSVDIGLANNIPFINVIGLGLSTQVNRVVRQDLKRWFGVFAFIYTALKVGLRMTPFSVQIDCDGTVHRALTWQVTVCNGRNYGSGLIIHEQANLKDGTLHGLSTEVKKWWHVFVLVPALLRGKFKPGDDVTVFSGQKIILKTRHSMQVDIDGDIKTRTPLTIEVLPKSLKVYVSNVS